MILRSALIVVGAWFISISYLLLVGLVASGVALLSARFGFDPYALDGGIAIALAVTITELGITFVARKPGPILLAYAIPLILVSIGLSRVATSEHIRDLIAKLGQRIRTPPIVPFR